MSVCDKDCFNCPYPDCINDEMDHADYIASAELDRELQQTPKKKKVAAAKRAYYEANRENASERRKEHAGVSNLPRLWGAFGQRGDVRLQKKTA